MEFNRLRKNKKLDQFEPDTLKRGEKTRCSPPGLILTGKNLIDKDIQLSASLPDKFKQDLKRKFSIKLDENVRRAKEAQQTILGQVHDFKNMTSEQVVREHFNDLTR